MNNSCADGTGKEPINCIYQAIHGITLKIGELEFNLNRNEISTFLPGESKKNLRFLAFCLQIDNKRHKLLFCSPCIFSLEEISNFFFLCPFSIEKERRNSILVTIQISCNADNLSLMAFYMRSKWIYLHGKKCVTPVLSTFLL